MGERVRLSDGRWIILPEGISVEDRDKLLTDLEASLRPPEEQQYLSGYSKQFCWANKVFRRSRHLTKIPKAKRGPDKN